MTQGKQVLFIVLALVVLGIGSIIGYGTGVEQGKQSESKKLDETLTKFTLLPRSEFITSWRTTVRGGIVEAVDQRSITIRNEEQTVEFLLSDNVQVSEVQENDSVTLRVDASPEGDIVVTKITIVARPE